MFNITFVGKNNGEGLRRAIKKLRKISLSLYELCFKGLKFEAGGEH